MSSKLHAWVDKPVNFMLALALLPIMVPILIIFILSGIGMYFYDKWNDGFNN